MNSNIIIFIFVIVLFCISISVGISIYVYNTQNSITTTTNNPTISAFKFYTKTPTNTVKTTNNQINTNTYNVQTQNIPTTTKNTYTNAQTQFIPTTTTNIPITTTTTNIPITTTDVPKTTDIQTTTNTPILTTKPETSFSQIVPELAPLSISQETTQLPTTTVKPICNYNVLDTNKLDMGSGVKMCSGLISKNKKYMLVLTLNGNLNIIRKSDNNIIWSTNNITDESQKPFYLNFSKDGNLSIVDKDKKTIWETNTKSEYSYAQIETNGNFIIWDAPVNGKYIKVAWSALPVATPREYSYYENTDIQESSTFSRSVNVEGCKTICDNIECTGFAIDDYGNCEFKNVGNTGTPKYKYKSKYYYTGDGPGQAQQPSTLAPERTYNKYANTTYNMGWLMDRRNQNYESCKKDCDNTTKCNSFTIYKNGLCKLSQMSPNINPAYDPIYTADADFYYVGDNVARGPAIPPEVKKVYRSFPKTNYTGTGVTELQTPNRSINVNYCVSLCNRNDECTAYTYDQNGFCKLKKIDNTAQPTYDENSTLNYDVNFKPVNGAAKSPAEILEENYRKTFTPAPITTTSAPLSSCTDISSSFTNTQPVRWSKNERTLAISTINKHDSSKTETYLQTLTNTELLSLLQKYCMYPVPACVGNDAIYNNKYTYDNFPMNKKLNTCEAIVDATDSNKFVQQSDGKAIIYGYGGDVLWTFNDFTPPNGDYYITFDKNGICQLPYDSKSSVKSCIPAVNPLTSVPSRLIMLNNGSLEIAQDYGKKGGLHTIWNSDFETLNYGFYIKLKNSTGTMCMADTGDGTIFTNTIGVLSYIPDTNSDESIYWKIDNGYIINKKTGRCLTVDKKSNKIIPIKCDMTGKSYRPYQMWQSIGKGENPLEPGIKQTVWKNTKSGKFLYFT